MKTAELLPKPVSRSFERYNLSNELAICQIVKNIDAVRADVADSVNMSVNGRSQIDSLSVIRADLGIHNYKTYFGHF